jgi:hypothetical protein
MWKFATMSSVLGDRPGEAIDASFSRRAHRRF